jgi:uncharacterized protein
MKFLVLIAVILAVAWYIRNSNRRDDAGAARGRAAPPSGPQDMVQCPVCAVHLPRTDALAGPDGRLYCSNEHRLRGQ